MQNDPCHPLCPGGRVNFFDTAANYGCGHSERILSRALPGRRDQVILATKFGYIVDEEKRIVTETDNVVPSIRGECEDSLRRLQTDYIDHYQFHVNDTRRRRPRT